MNMFSFLGLDFRPMFCVVNGVVSGIFRTTRFKSNEYHDIVNVSGTRNLKGTWDLLIPWGIPYSQKLLQVNFSHDWKQKKTKKLILGKGFVSTTCH